MTGQGDFECPVYQTGNADSITKRTNENHEEIAGLMAKGFG